MCTLTYLPVSGGFLLTSNRDERSYRKRALPPQRINRLHKQILSPVDGDAGGTWLAASPTLSCCLLNGAWAFHRSNPPYRKSRGVMVMEVFDYPSVEAFLSEYDFEGIEPFTMVFFEMERGITRLREWRWDGIQGYETHYSPSSPHIWSSVTLYSPMIRAERDRWFREWLLQHPQYQSEDIIAFHHFGGDSRKEIALTMQREGGQTVSISAIHQHRKGLSFLYEDLLTSERYEEAWGDKQEAI